MASFDRGISQAGLQVILACTKPDGAEWFKHLLTKWRPAGQDSGADGLRLAIRNGYLNFYRRGQSIARVSFGRGSRPRAEVHIKYVAEGATEQRYAKLNGSDLTCRSFDNLQSYAGIRTLEKWIEASEKYAGAEKKFVDRILTHNADAIDLEMGLPAASKGDAAPRMDLVVLEPRDDGHCIVFWEAKVMGDGRLRRHDPAQPPEVVGQLEDYRQWVEKLGHKEMIAQAYKRNCELLVALHGQARTINPSIGDLGSAVVDVARQSRIPDVDSTPRLLIDDRPPSKSWADHEHKLSAIDPQYVRDESADSFKLRTIA